MANVSLGTLYELNAKGSGSQQQVGSVTIVNQGNKSLSALVQNVTPFSASNHLYSSEIYDFNNGNLSGEPMFNGAVSQVTQRNISLDKMSHFTQSTGEIPWQTSSGGSEFQTMTYKYVPMGWADTKPIATRECTQKITDMVNFSSVNQRDIADKSGSLGLPFYSGSNPAFTQDFNGTLTLGKNSGVTSTNAQGWYKNIHRMGNGVIIPNGSGSYKIPEGNGYTSVLFAFWFKQPEYPTAYTALWCNGYPNGGQQFNSMWTPYSGFMFQVGPLGGMRLIYGDGSGAGSQDRRSFQLTTTYNENEWTFVCVRSNGFNTTTNTTTNFAYVYNNQGRGYGWSNGLSFLSGTGGVVRYMSGTELIFNPGHASRSLIETQVGHFYMFWEITGSGVSFPQMTQMADVTNSGSYNLYSVV